MLNYQQIAETLQNSLKLTLPPIAVSIADTIPPGLATPQSIAPAGCAFWEQAAQGALATSAQDHELCAVGIYTHNLADAPSTYASELGNVLQVMAGLEYARAEDVALIPVLKRTSKHVIYAPLAATPLPPDVVLLFAHANQSLMIAEAIQQVEMDMPPALGRPACALIPQVINNGRAALSLGCCGARAYLDALTDEVALWGLPGARIEEYAERVGKLAKANRLLTQFHTLRRQDVASGQKPTYSESLARL